MAACLMMISSPETPENDQDFKMKIFLLKFVTKSEQMWFNFQNILMILLAIAEFVYILYGYKLWIINESQEGLVIAQWYKTTASL